jgi:hypothetical protein
MKGSQMQVRARSCANERERGRARLAKVDRPWSDSGVRNRVGAGGNDTRAKHLGDDQGLG